MKIGFRVRHQAEESAGFITNAGDGRNRTVRVQWIIHDWSTIFRIAILNDGQMFRLDLLQQGFTLNNKFSLTVTNRQVNPIQPPGKDAG